MKKFIAVFLVLCFSVTAMAAAAEDDVIGYYLDDHPEAAVYVSAWVAENGDWRVEGHSEDGGLKLMVVHKLGSNKEDIWEYPAEMGKDGRLEVDPLGLHYQQDTVTYNWDANYYEDGCTEFSINEEGRLIWKDLKEDAGKGLAFDKIGPFYGGRWMKGDLEVIFFDWYDGQYDIRLYQRGSENEILKDAILKGDYDAATNSVTITGGFDGEDPITFTISYDADNHLVWTENGESTELEYSLLTD